MTQERSTRRSEELSRRARTYLPGGVTGVERYAEPYPIAFTRGKGKWLTDVDGNVYLDYHGGLGSAVLGYSHPEVDAAVVRAIGEGRTFVGVPHPGEVELAERLCNEIPSAERVAFCGGGGSDAIYHAIRIARAATGRTKIVKVEGGYHGWHSDVGVSTRPSIDDPVDTGVVEGVPNSAGSLEAVLAEVIVVSVNNKEALERVFDEQGTSIAAVIVEPVLYSAGCILVDDSYLELARRLCTLNSSALIFDEVLTGFRNGLEGAGARAGVISDLAVFGKAIANGYIMSALTGNAELIGSLAPEGAVFYSGTYNGHPLSLAAAMATLDVLERDGVPERLNALSAQMAEGINQMIHDLGVRAVCQAHGSVWSLYFNTESVRSYRDLLLAATPRIETLNEKFLMFLRMRGIYVPKRHANRCFISAQHDQTDVTRTIEVIADFLELHREELMARDKKATSS